MVKQLFIYRVRQAVVAAAVMAAGRRLQNLEAEGGGSGMSVIKQAVSVVPGSKIIVTIGSDGTGGNAQANATGTSGAYGGGGGSARSSAGGAAGFARQAAYGYDSGGSGGSSGINGKDGAGAPGIIIVEW